MIKYFEQYTDFDPYGEEDWDDNSYIIKKYYSGDPPQKGYRFYLTINNKIIRDFETFNEELCWGKSEKLNAEDIKNLKDGSYYITNGYKWGSKIFQKITLKELEERLGKIKIFENYKLNEELDHILDPYGEEDWGEDEYIIKKFVTNRIKQQNGMRYYLCINNKVVKDLNTFETFYDEWNLEKLNKNDIEKLKSGEYYITNGYNWGSNGLFQKTTLKKLEERLGKIKIFENNTFLNESVSSYIKYLLLSGLLTFTVITKAMNSKNITKREFLKYYRTALREIGKSPDKKIINFLQEPDTLLPAIIWVSDTTKNSKYYYNKPDMTGEIPEDLDLSNKWMITINGYIRIVNNDVIFLDSDKKPLNNKFNVLNWKIKDKNNLIKKMNLISFNNILMDHLNKNIKISENTKLYEIELDDQDIFQLIVKMEEQLGIKVDDNQLINILYDKNITVKKLIEFVNSFI